MANRRRDLLVRGATVLDPALPLERADIRVRGSRIVELGPHIRTDGAKLLDASEMLVMPGLINGHTHSGQSLDRGLVPNLPLDLWMLWAVYGGVEPTPDEMYTAVASGAIEMLRTGSTCVLDQPAIPMANAEAYIDAVMSAYADTGIRAGVALMLQDRDFFDSLPLDLVKDVPRPAPMSPPRSPQSVAAILEAFLTAWTDRHPRLQPMLGPSAPQRCTDELLRLVSSLAEEGQARVHMHLLETKSQVLATRQLFGRPVVEHLGSLGLLTPRTSFAHGVWLTPDEFRVLKGAGVTLVYNPISNLRCGSGILPVQFLLDLGLPLAVGTDGAASNDNQNMFEALKFGTLMQTLYGDHHHWPQPIDVWTASLRGGRSALGWPIGGIQPGNLADLVLLRLDRHVPRSKESLVASLVFAEHGESVDTAIVGGDVVVRGGRSTLHSEQVLWSRAHAFMRRAAERRADRRETYESGEPIVSRMLRAVDGTDLAVRRLGDVDCTLPHD